MVTKEVVFYEISKPQKAKFIWDFLLASKDSERLLVHVENAEMAQRLDLFLWSNQKDSFIPHGILPCEPSDTKLLIADGENELYGGLAEILILAVPSSFAYMSLFPRVIDFAETYDPYKKVESRNRFKAWVNHGLTPKFVKE